jgi:hypothetical protein
MFQCTVILKHVAAEFLVKKIAAEFLVKITSV